MSSPAPAKPPTWVDTKRLLQQHPITDLATRYGVELRRAGSALSGRCPFHADGGRANFFVYHRSGRFVCFRCQARGDAIDFVQRLEHVSFLEAAARLGAEAVHTTPPRVRLSRRPRPTEKHNFAADGERASVLDAAVELYTNRLLADVRALAYLAERGFPRALLERERIGYAAGDELIPYLVWRGLRPTVARRAGLIGMDRQEVMEGRIVFPELRQGRPVWLVGRLLDTTRDAPRYLGLAGHKPLLGWDEASRDLRGVCLVEGPTDLLALRLWGVPGLALCGTGLSPSTMEAIGRWKRLYIVMDADAAGQEAAIRLVEAFGRRAVPVALPPGVKDPADLAARGDGGMLFAEAIREALARTSEPAIGAVADLGNSATRSHRSAVEA